MAVYGVDFYGLSLYGTDQVVEFDVSPFLAISLTYGQTYVSWGIPGGSWIDFRLLRNRNGYPADENDGEILLEQTNSNSVDFLDINTVPGTYSYYAIYLQVDDTTWVRGGVTSCLQTKDFGSSSWLFNNIPDYFKYISEGELTADAVGNQYLYQFIKIFGWGLDDLKTQYDIAARVNDTSRINIQSLQSLAQTLGVEFDPEIQGYTMRQRVDNAAHIAREKGTPGGWRNLINVMTGWDADITSGRNLMLDDDQASFVHPMYPDWSPYTNYAVGEIVAFNSHWYSANTGGAYGQLQQPNNDGTGNTWWAPVSNVESLYLINAKTGGQNTWEALSYTPGVTADQVDLRLGVGTVSPHDPNVTAYNSIFARNASASVTGDLGLRSVSRVRRELGTVSAITSTSSSVIVSPPSNSSVLFPNAFPYLGYIGWAENPSTSEAVIVTGQTNSVFNGITTVSLNITRAASHTTAQSWAKGKSFFIQDSTMDTEQPLLDGIPIPWVRDSQEWNPSIQYNTNDIVLYAGHPYLAQRASIGVIPPYPDFTTPSKEWIAIGFDRRIGMMLSGYTHQPFTVPSDPTVPVYPFVEWYDSQGNLITTVIASSPYTGHDSVRLATTADLGTYTYAPGTITGTATHIFVDGTSVAHLDRILVKNQTDPRQNGIYTVLVGGTNSPAQDWVLIRANDALSSSQFVNGMSVTVTDGATNVGTQWSLTNTGTITLDTTNLTFAQNPLPWTPGHVAFDSFSNNWGSSNLSGRVMDTAPYSWTSAIGQWNVDGFEGGSTYPTTVDARAMALMTGDKNCQLSVTFKTSPSSDQVQGMIFRYSASNSYWRADRTTLKKKVSGAWTTMGTYSTTFADGDRMTVIMNGSAINIYRNANMTTPVLSVTDSFNNSATQHGMVVEGPTA